MPSLVYQNGQSDCGILHLQTSKYIYECCDVEIFRCGKIYYSNFIIINNIVVTFIYNGWFKNVFSAYFGIEISLSLYQIYFQFLIGPVLHIINVFHC
jgi:hypothetical protein